jgi:hypothetical protein
MSRVAFYGGVALIVVGVIYWLLRPSPPKQRNVIVLPGGFRFELNTPAFTLVGFGIVLMLIGQQFPDRFGPKPPPETKDFDLSGAVVRFGCEQDATAQISYNASPGWKIISATALVGQDTGNVKQQNAQIVTQTERHVEVNATFRGRDRNLGIDCPSGGHGQARNTGKSQSE